MFKKIVSYEDALKLLGKNVVTVRKRDAMPIGEVGKVVAILDETVFSNFDYAVIVQFNNCSKKNILHYIPYNSYLLNLYKNFDYSKNHIKLLFFTFYPNDLQELSNN